MTGMRIERDSLGEVPVPSEALWGAQTQRSYENFPIGVETMPLEIVYALARLKAAAARANASLGVLADEKSALICRVSEEILSGMHDGQFPLAVWQTGSGTHALAPQ